MALISVVCPHCQSDKDVVENGKTAQGKQRFLCRSQSSQGRTFMLNPSYPGRTPAVKEQIVEMSLNSSGIRDISRVLHVSTRTVIGELKKHKRLKAVNEPLLQQLETGQLCVGIVPVALVGEGEAAESGLDEMWSFVQKKTNQRWLWWAIDHNSRKVLASGFGKHSDAVFKKLQALLEPFGIEKFYPDGWGAYERCLENEQHQVGKANTQRIERKHLTLRTRIKRTPLAERSSIARETICFSKSE